MDKYYVYRPALDLIGYTEGTDKGRGYNETLDYGAYTGGDVELVKMTLDELDKLQTKMLRHPKNKLKSSAAGRYQIVRTTAREIREKLPDRYPSDRKFDKDCQDEMGCYLLGLRGIDKYLAGRLSEDTLINNLAKEWASFPTTEGKGHYGDQHAAVTTSRVRLMLKEVKARHLEDQPLEQIEVKVPVPTPVPVPVTPPSADAPWWKSKEVLGPATTSVLGGSLATYFEKFGGIPTTNLLIILGFMTFLLVGFLLYNKRQDQKNVAKQVAKIEAST